MSIEILIPSEKRFTVLEGGKKLLFQNGEINGCCQQPDSLFLAHKDEENGLFVWECKVCHRNHYVAKAEAGRYGIMGPDKILGGKNA